MEHPPLTLTFDPLTIEHLGSNMYSRLPNAVAELVANAYDADATRVEVRTEGAVPDQSISVWDDGHGMSWEDLNEKYLRIGRNRRHDAGGGSEGGRRRVSGKKGLGKLALFGIGDCVEVRTTRDGSAQATVVVLDWKRLRESGGQRDGERAAYRPEAETIPSEASAHGTTVTVSRLSRKTAISPTDLAASLSRLFIYGPEDLDVDVVGTDGLHHPVGSEPDFDGLDVEFEWEVPNDLRGEYVRVLEENGVVGKIVASGKPLRGRPRGVVVYANGRLANEPEFFGASASSHAYAYITGYVEIDRLDELRPDIIATDRRAVNWDHAEAAPIHHALQQAMTFIGTDHRRKRQDKKEENVRRTTGGDSQEWRESVRGPGREGLGRALNTLLDDDSDIPAKETEELLEAIRGIAPPFADLFWQDLHPWVKEVAREHYSKGEYHLAVDASWKSYISHVLGRIGSEHDGEDKAVLGRAFGAHKSNDKAALLSVTAKAVAGGAQLRKSTIASLEEGQRELSVGVASAFRNPLAHELHHRLDECGMLTYRQCLDALAIISFLCSRAEGAELR